MVQKWRTTTYAVPTSGDFFGDIADKNIDGIETAITHYAGDVDPSTGASWGVNQVGAYWLDLDVDGTDTDPVLKRWEDLTGGGSYGWRWMRHWRWHYLSAPQSVSFSPGSPYTSDQVATDVDLTTLLDSVQTNTAKTVVAVLMRVKVVDTGTLGTGSANEVYAEFKKKGDTVVQQVRCLVSNVENEQTIIVGLDASEIFQFAVVVANTSPSFTLEAEVIGYMEEV